MLYGIPDLPPLTGRAPIQTRRGAPIEDVEQYFPVKAWTDAYAHNKWRSYVYAPKGIASQVRDAAVSYLNDKLNLKVDRKKSDEACHLTT